MGIIWPGLSESIELKDPDSGKLPYAVQDILNHFRRLKHNWPKCFARIPSPYWPVFATLREFDSCREVIREIYMPLVTLVLNRSDISKFHKDLILDELEALHLTLNVNEDRFRHIAPVGWIDMLNLF